MKKKEKATYVIISIAVGILVSFSFLGGLFYGLELFLEDTLFSTKPISEEIVIIAIDDKSIQEIGQWPWPREVFSILITKLESNRP